MYEKKHPFPGLLINYDDGSYVDADDSDDDDRDPNWLSQMFEYGFIRFIKLTSHNQASQLLQIIQTAIRGFEMLEHFAKMGKRKLDECPALKASYSH